MTINGDCAILPGLRILPHPGSVRHLATVPCVAESGIDVLEYGRDDRRHRELPPRAARCWVFSTSPISFAGHVKHSSWMDPCPNTSGHLSGNDTARTYIPENRTAPGTAPKAPNRLWPDLEKNQLEKNSLSLAESWLPGWEPHPSRRGRSLASRAPRISRLIAEGSPLVRCP
jgi:hypothetical protein